MFYIPGIKFKVGDAPVKKSGSLLAQKMVRSRVDTSSPLKNGQIYTLYHINRKPDGSYVYQFKGLEGIIDIPFANRKIAEDYIAHISGKLDSLKSQRETQRRVNEN